MVRGGGGLLVGQGMVVNNTLQWKLFRERVYNIFSYTQLFRVKNFSSICLYCIISSKPCGGEGVLVQNFAARGLALQTIKLISLLCIVHRKKHKKQKNSFHLNINKISLAFLFNNLLELTNKTTFLLSNTITISSFYRQSSSFLCDLLYTQTPFCLLLFILHTKQLFTPPSPPSMWGRSAIQTSPLFPVTQLKKIKILMWK